MNDNNALSQKVSSSDNGTDVLLDENVSRETSAKQAKKKVELDAVRKKCGITDNNPYDFNNPSLKELYASFRQNKLTVVESSFNALYLWCYDNYYSSGVPVKSKYKNIYAHPAAWFQNAHHMWRHNKWSVAVRLLEIVPAISKLSQKNKQKRKRANESFWKTFEYSHLSAQKALGLFVNFAAIAGIIAISVLWNSKAKDFSNTPALSLYIDGEYVGEVLSVAAAESAKSSIENNLSTNLGISYSLDCDIDYIATRIPEGSALTPARLGRAFGEAAHKHMKPGFGLYAYDVPVAVVENREWLESSMNESLYLKLSDEQKKDESIQKVSYNHLTIREGAYPEHLFLSNNELRQMFSLPPLIDNEAGISDAQPAALNADEEASADHLNVTDRTTLLSTTSDSGISSDIGETNSSSSKHQITIEAVITKTETQNESVPYGTDYIYDETLAENKQILKEKGLGGSKTATYHVEYVENKEIGRRLINQVIVSEPKNQVIIQGTRPLTEEEKRVASTGTYIYPSQGELSSGYSWRTWGSYNEFHKGIDIRSDKGLELVASDGGTVIQAKNRGDGYGLCVLIEHDDGTITRYAHCSKLHVKEGQKVAQGEYIADMGRTGKATGVHVHFEIIKNGSVVNPMNYLEPRN